VIAHPLNEPVFREVKLGGLWLCERHAERLRLEERAHCWRAILAHIKMWSGEARNRERDDVALEFAPELARGRRLK
jgi:hypothetical protein